MLTVPEAARIVGSDPATVRRWIRSGKLRSQGLGAERPTPGCGAGRIGSDS
jgi:excisionase family DNA binding protein